MLKFFRPPNSFVAYVLVLLTFVALGLLVAALANGNGAAVLVVGGVLAGCSVGAVVGFRSVARGLVESRPGTDLGSAVSIFSIPLPQDQIDRYVDTYRKDSAAQARIETADSDPRVTTRLPEYRRAA